VHGRQKNQRLLERRHFDETLTSNDEKKQRVPRTRRWRNAFAAHGMRALVLFDAIATGAGGSHAISPVGAGLAEGVVTISGTIADKQNRALQGVTVQVGGSMQALATTDANGTYAITASARAAGIGPWSVHPSRVGCQFIPPLAKLSNLATKTFVDFTGTGAGCVGTTAVLSSAIDPGPRPGPPGAGGPTIHNRGRAVPQSAAQQEEAAVACIHGLAPPMLLLCEQAFVRFQLVVSVSGTIPDEEAPGLGPTFNGNSCAMCHAQPAVLGSSPGPLSPQNPVPNPLVALATRDGARNIVPPFITLDGPVRIARFKSDNDVHDLYTIAGRSDAHGCAQAQPDFAAKLAQGNVSFRIPLALFGLGFVEAVSEATLQANLAASSSPELGIAGSFNKPGNDGTIHRFGRKAQDKSLLAFAGESYNLELGVTNELFPQERYASQGCAFNGIPEDMSDPMRTGSVSDMNSDIENFAIAIRLSAPPKPALPPGVTQGSVQNGQHVFESIGCADCHTPTLTTSTSNLDAALSNVQIHPFSDFAIHHMGTGLADGIVQGAAGPDQFRTTPLWGAGQRLFFLHDGRTSDVVDAIEAHASGGSEADTVITNFNSLTLADEQDLVNFLRSL
jgi:CxxC motif-containing protein (DUF1111 family)